MPSTSDKANDIEALIPHRPPFRFVDRVDRADASGAELSLELSLDDGRLTEGRLAPLFLVEALAQSTAAFHARVAGDVPEAGFLVDISNARLHAAARAGDVVHLTIQRERALGAMVRFAGTARCGERLLVETRLTVARRLGSNR